MAKVVIYGFGVVGKNLFRFLHDCEIKYAIANDEIIEYYSDDVKIDLIENIYIESGDIIAICTTHESYREMMFDRAAKALEKCGVQADIQCYENIEYASKYKKYIDKNQVSYLFSNGSSFTDLTCRIIADAKRRYEEAKIGRNERFRDIFQKRDGSENIFQDIYRLRLDDKSAMIRYPYFNTFFSDKAKDKEFGFRESIDWELVQNPEFRSKNKLICVFGNSQVHGGTLSDAENTFPCQLEKFLNTSAQKFKVLNCAYNGGSILEEIVLFITLFYRVKPDIVISMSGYDFVASFQCDKSLIEKHAFFYKSYDEKVYKDSAESSYPTLGEIGMLAHLDINTVFESFFFRLKQFEAMVEVNGGKFIACLQPILYAKNFITELESDNAKKYMKLDKVSYEKEKLIVKTVDTMRRFIDFCRNRKDNLKIQIDLNPVVENETESCFDDWIHLNGYGNAIISKVVADKILSISTGE